MTGKRRKRAKKPRAYQKRFPEYRSQNNVEKRLYARFRRTVRKRDNFTCQFPGCGSKKNIQVHHILRWQDYPLLRYEPTNGICLCKDCHKSIYKHEYLYINMFHKIVERNMRDNK